MMFKASCLCGAVTIKIEGALEHAPEACHCTQCRKHSGSFLMGVNVRKTRLTVTGDDRVGWYQSSDMVARGFCQECGSTLFWKPLMEDYEWISIAAGAFDTPIGARLAKQTFVAEKGDCYDLYPDIPATEAF